MGSFSPARVTRGCPGENPPAGLLAVGALAATFAWAFAFTRIYNRPMTRVEASRWIYQNVPAPINLQMENNQGETSSLPLSYPTDNVITPENGVAAAFTAQNNGAANEVTLNKINLSIGNAGQTQLKLELHSLENGIQILARGECWRSNPTCRTSRSPYRFDQLAVLKKGQRYAFKIDLTGENSRLVLAGNLMLKVVRKLSPDHTGYRKSDHPNWKTIYRLVFFSIPRQC